MSGVENIVSGDKNQPMNERLGLAQELMVAEQESLIEGWGEKGARVDRDKERASQYRLGIYGDELGSAINELLDPQDDEDDDLAWEVRSEQRKEVVAQAIQAAVEGDNTFKRLQGYRAIVDLAMYEYPHNHREFRMR